MDQVAVLKTKRKREMLTEERRQKILEMIEQNGRIMIQDIVSEFKVSAVTARADLDVLTDRGEALRSHGGAVRQLNPRVDYPLRFKETLHHAEKVRIAQSAVQLLKPGQTVILDSGTTTAQIARQIRIAHVHPLTVITHALNVAYELAEAEGVALIMIGGLLRQASSSFVGPQAERILEDLHSDHFFLAVDGLDVEAGFSTPDILEAQLNRIMIRLSHEVTVVADASKFGRRSLSVIGQVECAHRIITDQRVPENIAAAVRARGIDLVIA